MSTRRQRDGVPGGDSARPSVQCEHCISRLQVQASTAAVSTGEQGTKELQSMQKAYHFLAEYSRRQ